MRKFTLFLLGMVVSTCYSLSFSQTGYTDDGSSTAGWYDENTGEYSFSTDGSILTVDVGWSRPPGDGWKQGFGKNLGSTIDISANPVLTMRVRALDKPVVLNAYISDGIYSKNIARKITKTDEFIWVTFDYNGNSGSVDLTQVTRMFFKANAESTGWSGDILIDEINLGSDATATANMSGHANVASFAGSTGNKIVISDIENASALDLSTVPSFVSNVSVSAISNGVATISYDVSAGATATETAAITATATAGYADNVYTFAITREGENLPTISTLPDMDVASGVESTIKLKGLSDGNANANQDLTITATSDNTGVTGSFTVNYTQGSPYGEITFTPSGDQTGITVTVTVDDGLGQITEDFLLDVYASYNYAPSFDKITGAEFFQKVNPVTIQLTGITDGDGTSQELTYVVTSSVDSVVPNSSLSVNHIPGQSSGLLNLLPAKVGFTTITITATDDGGATSNGNASFETSFELEVKPVPLTGYTFDLSILDTTQNKDDFIIAEPGKWFIENTTTQGLEVGTFKGFDDVFHIEMNNKFRWTGIWLRTPDFDLTENPVLSYDIYFENISGSPTDMQTHTYFWDVGWDGGLSRNTNATHAERKTVPVGQWVSVLMDFRAPGMLLNKDGVDINIKRIQKLLFNYHTGFTTSDGNISGDVYIKNIRIGDQAENVNPITPQCTVDDIANFAYTQGAVTGTVNIPVTGISDGEGTLTNVTAGISSSNSGWVNPTISAINSDGTATISFTPPATTGSSTITISIANGSANIDKDISFGINVLSNDAGTASDIAIDLSNTHQTIRGFGTYMNSPSYNEYYALDGGMSAIRIGLIGNQIELENDNNDPYVLDRSALNYSAFNFEYFKDLKEKGVESFILTSWSPPGWMKDNFTMSHIRAGVDVNCDNTANKLSYHMYEEFAESMVAAYRMFEEEAGIQLTGIGLQNEPAFHEWYPSGILDPTRFVELINVVGARFASEGITCELYMPEQVFTQNANSMAAYIDAVQADATANQYCRAIATHGYSDNGIDPGAPDNTQWTTMWNNAQEGSYPKEMWMTETWPQFSSWQSAVEYATNIWGALEAGNVSLWTIWSIDGTLMNQGSPTGQFYTNKAFSKYIRPGATRVTTTSANVEVLATSFVNETADGANKVTVLINKSTSPVAVDLSYTGGTAPTTLDIYQAAQYRNFEHLGSAAPGDVISLPALSVTTVVGGGTKSTLTVTSGSGDGDYLPNSQVTITADAAPGGQEFDRWSVVSGDITISNPANSTTTVYVTTENATVEAIYRNLPIFDLTVNKGNNSGSYTYGDAITVTADAAHVDSVFNGWIGDVDVLDDVLNETVHLTMPARNITITATYRGKNVATYTLSVPNDSILGTAAKSIELIEGATATIIATPAAVGESFNAWTGTGLTALDDVNAKTAVVTMGTENVTATASYTKMTYPLTINKGTGSGSYEFQEIVNISPTPHDDSVFVAWTGDIATVADVNSANTTVTMPAGGLEITATYAPKVHTVTIRVVDGATAIEGALINMEGEVKNTDANGEASFGITRGPKGYKVTATGYPSVTQSVSIWQDSTIIIDYATDGINDNLAGEIKLYPNPAGNVLNVQSLNYDLQQIVINDLTGRTIEMIETSSTQEVIDLSRLSSGLYIITIKTSDAEFKAEFIKQ